jgi:hypothetical protein
MWSFKLAHVRFAFCCVEYSAVESRAPFNFQGIRIFLVGKGACYSISASTAAAARLEGDQDGPRGNLPIAGSQ